MLVGSVLRSLGMAGLLLVVGCAEGVQELPELSVVCREPSTSVDGFDFWRFQVHRDRVLPSGDRFVYIDRSGEPLARVIAWDPSSGDSEVLLEVHGALELLDANAEVVAASQTLADGTKRLHLLSGSEKRHIATEGLLPRVGPRRGHVIDGQGRVSWLDPHRSAILRWGGGPTSETVFELENLLPPAAHDDRLVWAAGDYRGRTVYSYLSGNIDEIARSVDDASPLVVGDSVFWVTTKGIFEFNVRSKVERRVFEGLCSAADMSGRRVAFVCGRRAETSLVVIHEADVQVIGPEKTSIMALALVEDGVLWAEERDACDSEDGEGRVYYRHIGARSAVGLGKHKAPCGLLDGSFKIVGSNDHVLWNYSIRDFQHYSFSGVATANLCTVY